MMMMLLPLDLWTNPVAVAELLAQWSDHMAENRRAKLEGALQRGSQDLTKGGSNNS